MCALGKRAFPGSSREVRIRVPDFFSVVYFSRGTLPQEKATGGPSFQLRSLTHALICPTRCLGFNPLLSPWEGLHTRGFLWLKGHLWTQLPDIAPFRNPTVSDSIPTQVPHAMASTMISFRGAKWISSLQRPSANNACPNPERDQVKEVCVKSACRVYAPGTSHHLFASVPMFCWGCEYEDFQMENPDQTTQDGLHYPPRG